MDVRRAGGGTGRRGSRRRRRNRHGSPYRTRARVTLDGVFWGGVLMVSTVAGLLAVIVMAVFHGAEP